MGAVIAVTMGCAQRGSITIDPAAAAVGAVVPIYVATTRAFDEETQTYGNQRSETLSFAQYDVSVPPDRVAGELSFAPRNRPADPKVDFLTTHAERMADPADYQSALAAALRARQPGDRDVVIFVHGFNNTFAEGLYRLAQMSHDLSLPGIPVHYAWPSKGAALGYVADRDSALFSRDGLESLIQLSEAAGAENVILVAHSMGSALLMESLRQMAIRGNRQALDGIGGVILISPDLDVDVFRSQARTVGALPQPFMIFGSDRDQILNLSARLTGEPERLGNLTDIDRLADLDVTYVQSGAFSEGAGHFNLGTSPALIQLLSQIGSVDAFLAQDRRNRTGLLPGLVLTVRNATEIILAPVTVISQGQ